MTADVRAAPRSIDYEWSRHVPWELFFHPKDYDRLSNILEGHLLR